MGSDVGVRVWCLVSGYNRPPIRFGGVGVGARRGVVGGVSYVE